MTVTDRMRETATEWKDDLHQTVDHLKEEVAGLKKHIAQLNPFRRQTTLPVRREPSMRLGRRTPWLTTDPWLGAAPAWPGWDDMMDRFDFGPQLTDLDWPQIDITEKDDQIAIRAEVPGVKEEDIDISVRDDMLIIRGEKHSESEDRGRDHYRRECYYGTFHRSIPLPEYVDREGVEATFRNGVLDITLPRTESARSSVRHIPVRQG